MPTKQGQRREISSAEANPDAKPETDAHTSRRPSRAVRNKQKVTKPIHHAPLRAARVGVR
jgi:hypothetical protein